MAPGAGGVAGEWSVVCGCVARWLWMCGVGQGVRMRQLWPFMHACSWVDLHTILRAQHAHTQAGISRSQSLSVLRTASLP